MAEFATFEEVIRLCSGSKWTMSGSSEMRGPCPKCGSKTAVNVSLNKNIGHCWKCDTKYNYQTYFAAYYGLSNADAKKAILNQLGRDLTVYKAPKLPVVETSPLADISVRHKVYAQFLANLELQDKQKQALLNRGLKEEEISRLGYKSFPTDLRGAANLLIKEGYNLQGIPGFFYNEGHWEVRKLKSGTLFPYRDAHNRIQGFQLRKDNDVLKVWKEDGEERKEKKCNWFSSNNMEAGTKANGFIHFACDFYYSFADDSEMPVIPDDTLLLTEGGMKADIIHLLSGFAVIAVPGVYNLKEFKKIQSSLTELGVKHIVNCFDMDYVTNEQVAEACERMKALIQDAGFNYSRWKWKTDCPEGKDLKGLDDFLMYKKRGVIPKF